MAKLAEKTNLKAITSVSKLPPSIQNEEIWSDTINSCSKGGVGRSSHIDDCLRIGREHPKYLVGLLALARPEFLSRTRLKVIDPIVEETEIEFKSTFGMLKSKSTFVSLKVMHMLAQDVPGWAVAFPRITLIDVGLGQSPEEALDDWKNGFKWHFFDALKQIELENNWDSNGDWKAWCSVFSLSHYPKVSRPDAHRDLLDDDEQMMSYFGQVVNVGGGNVEVRWLNAPDGELTDLKKIPGSSKIRELATGTWFSTQVVQRLSTSEIVFIVDAIPGDEPETGRLTPDERRKLLSRHSKLLPGLLRGPITDK